MSEVSTPSRHRTFDKLHPIEQIRNRAFAVALHRGLGLSIGAVVDETTTAIHHLFVARDLKRGIIYDHRGRGERRIIPDFGATVGTSRPYKVTVIAESELLRLFPTDEDLIYKAGELIREEWPELEWLPLSRSE